MSKKAKFLNLFILTLISINASIYSQDNLQQITDPNLAQDKFYCVSIPTTVNGQEYDKTLKCETKDAICYVMEGFAMSCVPKVKNSLNTNQIQ